MMLFVLACFDAKVAEPAPTPESRWFDHVGQRLPADAKAVNFAVSELGTHLAVWVVDVDKQAFTYRTDSDESEPHKWLELPEAVSKQRGNAQLYAAADHLVSHFTPPRSQRFLGGRDHLLVHVVDEGTGWSAWNGEMTANGLKGERVVEHR